MKGSTKEALNSEVPTMDKPIRHQQSTNKSWSKKIPMNKALKIKEPQKASTNQLFCPTSFPPPPSCGVNVDRLRIKDSKVAAWW